MTKTKNKICPVELAGGLDSRIRRWLQNPRKIVGPYIEEGMTVLDVGCGPGFFTVEMAQLVGKSGRVIAADLQEGMLEKIKVKIQGTELEERITLHKCEADRIGISEQVDFVLLFYMVHEVPDVDALFKEIESILKPGGKILMVEPPFHVSKKGFEISIKKAEAAGLKVAGRPRSLINKSVLLDHRLSE